MPSKAELERRLSAVAGFENPTVELEQYPTPADLAAHLLHVADLQGDITDRLVVDLGTGTGMLALAAAFRNPRRVVGVELDPGALAVARENTAHVQPPTLPAWVLGDGTRPSLCVDDVTVLMNPPFGAQHDKKHADRAFLDTAADIARVSYSIHNEGSQSFVESFAADNDGTVTHAFRAQFELDNQFSFHDAASKTLNVEVFRVEWD